MSNKIEKHVCDFCGAEREKLTILEHPTGVRLHLCFRGCQHFPEPYRKTGLSEEWKRVDPWQDYKRSQPRLRKEYLKDV